MTDEPDIIEIEQLFLSEPESSERQLFLSVILQALLDATKENGDIIIFNGSLEMENAGYDASTIFKIAKGGYHKRNDRPKGYSIRKRHKDIIKVEYI